ncbi:MAG: hypothetical protein HY301_11355 [Verrucomicrobia bacterium]|nr:hypothetical protein [Verrucomicrobiota bacterium]
MKKLFTAGLASALCLGTFALPAQDANEAVKKQMEQMQENFNRALKEQREYFEKVIGAQSNKIDALTRQVEGTQQKQAEAAAKEKLKAEIESALAAQPKPAAPAVEVKQPWSPAQAIPLVKAGSAYMNISFDALMAAGSSTAGDPAAQLQLGDHDPLRRGFSLRNAEIALDGAVDPYFKGFANIVLKLDKNNDTAIELEETYLQSTSLPGGLQLKAGQFFAAFGRQNPQHPHQWAFVDAPIILTRAFGPDGLRNVGAQLSWLTPLPFYTEAFLGVFNGEGGTAHSFRNAGEPDAAGTLRYAGRATLGQHLSSGADLLFAPRIASSFDLSDTQTLLAGVSAAFGPNDTGANSRTEIYGADLFWKWKPTTAHAGFPFVSWQTEFLYRRFGAGADATAVPVLPAENITDWGFYSQLAWGFTERWVAGLRGEFVSGNNATFDRMDVFRGDRTRVSPALTFFPSEFSKVRLQYNYDHGQNFGDDHSVWLQLEFMLGAHGAHKY